MVVNRSRNFSLVFFLCFVVLLLLLFYSNGLIYHFLLDFIIILLALSVFVFSWSTQKYMQKSFYFLLGVMTAAVGVMYLYHLISFQNIILTTIQKINFSLQIHMITLSIEAITFLFAPLLLKSRKSHLLVLLIYAVITIGLLIYLSFGNSIPPCYVKSGISNICTFFSFFILFILVVSIFIYINYKECLSKNNYYKILTTIFLLISSAIVIILITIIPSSASFLIHLSHLFQLSSFYLIFDCIFTTGINNPLDLLMSSTKKSEDIYSKIFATMKEGFSINECRISKDGVFMGYKIVRTNPKFRELANITLDESYSTDNDPYWLSIYRDVHEYKKPINQVKFNKDTDQTIEIYSFYLGQGLICSLLHDITKRTEIEKRQNEFISTITNELKTPVTSIQESFNLLMNTYDQNQSKIQLHLQDICRRNILRLQKLVRQVMDYQRYEEIKVDLFSLEQINDILNEVIQDLLPVARKKGIVVTCNFQKNIPMFKMEKDSFRRVFLNILNNAVKFTNSGSVTIKTTYSNNCIFVSFIDTGIGINKNKIDRIFDPFSSANRETKSNSSGSGLGLSITKKIIESYGGTISISSEENVGSEVVIKIPTSDQNQNF